MHIPPFLRGRRKKASGRGGVAQFRAVLRAAQSVEGYRERLSAAGLHTTGSLHAVDDVEGALSGLLPLSRAHYDSLFPDRKPAWLRSPFLKESRSVYMLPYAEARSGIDTCHTPLRHGSDLYSAYGSAGATSDLYKLGRALSLPESTHGTSHGTLDYAIVAFSGLEAGLLTEGQRETLWIRHQVPLFEQFLGTDGRVVAGECEVHAGLHIRPGAAILEHIDGELAITSLTDEKSPALRVLSGFLCKIDREPCECGRVEPRIVQLRAA